MKSIAHSVLIVYKSMITFLHGFLNNIYINLGGFLISLTYFLVDDHQAHPTHPVSF